MDWDGLSVMLAASHNASFFANPITALRDTVLLTSLPYTDMFNYALLFKPIWIVFLFLFQKLSWGLRKKQMPSYRTTRTSVHTTSRHPGSNDEQCRRKQDTQYVLWITSLRSCFDNIPGNITELHSTSRRICDICPVIHFVYNTCICPKTTASITA